MQNLILSDNSRYIAGAALLTIVTIEIGGWFLVRVTQGDVPMTDFQKAFARAGHGHAGILVTLGLVNLLLVDAARLHGATGWIARLGVLVAAILMSAGFFLSSMGRGEVVRPNKLIVLVWIGAICLAAGVLTTGIGLLTA